MGSKTPVIVLILLLLAAVIAGMVMRSNYLRQISLLKERIDELEQEVDLLKEEKEELATQLREARMTEITVYFVKSLPREFVLVPVTRRVVREDNMPLVAVKELVAGPELDSGLMPSLPEGTRLLGVDVEGGIAQVNLSQEVVDNFNGGGRLEILLLAAIANTLTEFPWINAAQILVNGQKVESIGGHMEADKPIGRNEDVIGSP